MELLTVILSTSIIMCATEDVKPIAGYHTNVHPDQIEQSSHNHHSYHQPVAVYGVPEQHPSINTHNKYHNQKYTDSHTNYKPFAPPSHHVFQPPQQIYGQNSPNHHSPNGDIPNQYPKRISILRMANDMTYNGKFSYDYKTENGIEVQASGFLKKNHSPHGSIQVMRGKYSYTSPEGTPVSTLWYADETGFHVEGTHLPSNPAIHKAIGTTSNFHRPAAIRSDEQYFI